MFKRQTQRGFTLIEILVALAILSIIALLASTAFDGSRTKAQAMIGLTKQIADANIQLKTDTGCYVNKPIALFSYDDAQLPANNDCGRTFGNSWARAYLGQYTVNSDGSIMADKVSAGVTIALKSMASGVGSGKLYYVHADNVPVDIIKQALIECNNSATNDDPGSFPKDRCRSTVDLTAGGVGDFDFQYDSTR